MLKKQLTKGAGTRLGKYNSQKLFPNMQYFEQRAQLYDEPCSINDLGSDSVSH